MQEKIKKRNHYSDDQLSIFNTKYMIKILKFLQITENMQKKL